MTFTAATYIRTSLTGNTHSAAFLHELMAAL